MKKLLLVLSILCLIFASCSYSVEEYEIEHEFIPDEFIFEYNDHNTTTYEGDSGLSVAYVNNTADNTTLIVPKERVRSLAYDSKKSFKFSEPLIITRSIKRNDGRYILLTMKYKNGTEIPILDLDKNDLTNEQKEYFDDYNTQRSDYLMQQQEYTTEDLYDYQVSHNKNKNKGSKYSYYFGSNGRGIIYTPSYDSYW